MRRPAFLLGKHNTFQQHDGKKLSSTSTIYDESFNPFMAQETKFQDSGEEDEKGLIDESMVNQLQQDE